MIKSNLLYLNSGGFSTHFSMLSPHWLSNQSVKTNKRNIDEGESGAEGEAQMYFDQGRSLLLALELLRVHSKVDMIKAEALRHDFSFENPLGTVPSSPKWNRIKWTKRRCRTKNFKSQIQKNNCNSRVELPNTPTRRGPPSGQSKWPIASALNKNAPGENKFKKWFSSVGTATGS